MASRRTRKIRGFVTMSSAAPVGPGRRVDLVRGAHWIRYGSPMGSGPQDRPSFPKPLPDPPDTLQFLACTSAPVGSGSRNPVDGYERVTRGMK